MYHHQIVQFGLKTRKLDTVLVSDLKGGEPFSSLPHAFRLGLVTVVSIAPSQVKLNNIINLATIISDNCKAIHQANSVTNPSLKAWGLKEEDSPPS